MADHPDAPAELVDAAMDSNGARALLHRLGGAHERSNLRTDVSDIVAAVVALTEPKVVLLPSQRSVVIYD